jgi:hypothetical protein
MATTILSWNGETDQFSMVTQVNSPPPGLCCRYSMDTGAFSGNFSIMFSGLGSVYPPGDPFPAFFLTIPIQVGLDNDGIPYDDHASACLFDSACYSSDSGYPLQHTFLMQIPYFMASQPQPIIVPVGLTTSVIAWPYETLYESFATTASARVIVDFGDLVLKDRFGDDITSEISFTVTPPPGIPTPEPGSFLFAGAGLLALALRRILRPIS